MTHKYTILKKKALIAIFGLFLGVLILFLNTNKSFADKLDYSDTALYGGKYANNLKIGNIFEFYLSNNFTLNNIHIKISTSTSQAGSLKAYLFALSDRNPIPYDAENACVGNSLAWMPRYIPSPHYLYELVIASTTLNYDLSTDDLYLNFSSLNLSSGYYYLLIDSYNFNFYLKGKQFLIIVMTTCRIISITLLLFKQILIILIFIFLVSQIITFSFMRLLYFNLIMN
jgi:hypothetical protein